MSEVSIEKPNGKILFGVDYLHLMQTMEWDHNRSGIVIAVMKLFLLQWGLSVEEIQLSGTLFFNKMKDNTIGDTVEPALLRIYEFIKDNKEKQKQLLIEMVCVGLMDNNVTDREKFFNDYFKNKFNISPSEYGEIIKKGDDWAKVLKNLGAEYLENKQ